MLQRLYCTFFKDFFLLDLESFLAVSKMPLISQQVFFSFLYVNHGYWCSLKHWVEKQKCRLKRQPENSALIKINCAKNHCRSFHLVKRVIHFVNFVRSSEYLHALEGRVPQNKSDLHNVPLLCSFTKMIHQFIDQQCKPRNKSLVVEEFQHEC